jgi:predicted PurR-regulated permease PerM
MPLETRPPTVPRADTSSPQSKWTRRRDIPIAILAWIALVIVICWAAGHVIRSLLLLAIAALLAYALAPVAKLFERFMPRFLAILITYLVVLSGLGVLLYFIVTTAIQQISSLTQFVESSLTPNGLGQLTPLEQLLSRFGISQSQLATFRQQILGQVGGVASSAVPVLIGFFNFLLDMVLIAVLSIYLLVDGSRVTRWLRNNMPAPQQERANFLLDSLQTIVGGYIRGQLLLSALVGFLVGIGMAVFHVPYAVLLGVLAFILEFIPILGVIISGAICVLIALTQGWLIAVLVLAYFTIVHVIEGDVVGPRIVGKAVGLHPVVSIAALIAGSELFGLWGALFASPVAGILQALVVAFWSEWRARHPDQFPMKQKIAEKIDENVADKPVNPQNPTDSDGK